MSNLSRELGKMLLSPKIYVTVYTIGGIDDNGNEVDEPMVFEGNYASAKTFFANEENVDTINEILRNMPDGYIEIECGNYTREAYDAEDIMDEIENMLN